MPEKKICISPNYGGGGGGCIFPKFKEFKGKESAYSDKISMSGRSVSSFMLDTNTNSFTHCCQK